jgi:hypothetical protein
MNIVGTKEMILALRIAMPPGTSVEQAVNSVANNGLNIPLGLLQFVRSVHLEVVDTGSPCTIPAREGGGMMHVKQ